MDYFAALNATRSIAVRQTTNPTNDSQFQGSMPPAEGVLPDTLLRDAIRCGWVLAADGAIPGPNIQPASLDLRLGNVAYRLRSSFLPGDKVVSRSLKDHQLGPDIPLDNGAVLERNRPYLIPLMESLKLPSGIKAKANPKSSTGRLDIFTRIIVDKSPGFDEIPVGYCGPMYLEVVSRSFTIQVKDNLSLNQIRLIHGTSVVPDQELKRMHAQSPLLYYYGLDGKQPRAVDNLNPGDGLFLTVDLLGNADEIVGYRAKKNSQLLDLSQVGGYLREDFWEHVETDRGKRLILEPEEFYLLVSREGVAVPPQYAGEMTAYDPTSGELRTHYAGFFDPGFGFSEPNGLLGSRAVLEVRAHDVPFALENGQRIARLRYESMVKPPEHLYGPEIGSSYQNQRLKLSKLFREPLLKTSHQASYLESMARQDRLR